MSKFYMWLYEFFKEISDYFWKKAIYKKRK